MSHKKPSSGIAKNSITSLLMFFVLLVYDIDLTENDVDAPNKNGILIRAWVTKS